jgi:hypothetical protein
MERRSASQRIALIDDRLRQIEQAKQELLLAVDLSGQRLPSRPTGLEVKPAPRRSLGGFKIRY